MSQAGVKAKAKDAKEGVTRKNKVAPMSGQAAAQQNEKFATNVADKEMDLRSSVLEFIDEHFVISPSCVDFVPRESFVEQYFTFCKDKGRDVDGLFGLERMLLSFHSALDQLRHTASQQNKKKKSQIKGSHMVKTATKALKQANKDSLANPSNPLLTKKVRKKQEELKLAKLFGKRGCPVCSEVSKAEVAEVTDAQRFSQWQWGSILRKDPLTVFATVIVVWMLVNVVQLLCTTFAFNERYFRDALGPLPRAMGTRAVTRWERTGVAEPRPVVRR